MPLKDLKEKHGGSISRVLLSDLEERLEASLAAASASSGPQTSFATTQVNMSFGRASRLSA